MLDPIGFGSSMFVFLQGLHQVFVAQVQLVKDLAVTGINLVVLWVGREDFRGLNLFSHFREAWAVPDSHRGQQRVSERSADRDPGSLDLLVGDIRD